MIEYGRKLIFGDDKPDNNPGCWIFLIIEIVVLGYVLFKAFLV